MSANQTRPATPTSIVVIGGGYAGVMAANRLRRATMSTSRWSTRGRSSSSGSGCTSW